MDPCRDENAFELVENRVRAAHELRRVDAGARIHDACGQRRQMLGAHGQRASLDAMRGAPQRCAVGALERNLQCGNVGAHARLQLRQHFGNALWTAGELLDARTIDRIAARRGGRLG